MFNVPKAHAEGIEAEFSVHPLAGLDLSFAGSLLNSKFDSTIAQSGAGVEPVSAKATACRRCRNISWRRRRTMTRAFNSNADWYVNGSVQQIGNRYTQPGDQEPGAGIST